jgi:ABC-2 type transport system permease protein
MKAFTALVHRELIEHKGAFLYGPLVLVAVLFGATILVFTVGRVNAHFAGGMMTLAPLRVYELGFLGFGLTWCAYLLVTLFFYAADGFAADKRNNSMLFWKSMPVSDFRMLLAKLTAAVTILPGTVYGVALLSGALLFGVAFATTLVIGTGGIGTLANIVGIYGNVALAILATMVYGLLWYLPHIAVVGAVATAIGRWAIPVSLLGPAIVAILEWVTLGGRHPFTTHTWNYLTYRSTFPGEHGYVDAWFTGGDPFSGIAFVQDVFSRADWVQVGIGILVAIVALLIASEYRRRVNNN